MQALQKEREALAAQLQSSGPEQMHRLKAELAAAQGAAADATVMREQVVWHTCACMQGLWVWPLAYMRLCMHSS